MAKLPQNDNQSAAGSAENRCKLAVGLPPPRLPLGVVSLQSPVISLEYKKTDLGIIRQTFAADGSRLEAFAEARNYRSGFGDKFLRPFQLK